MQSGLIERGCIRQRSYYHVAQEGSGYCPADEALKIDDGFTPAVKRLAVKVAASVPYELAHELLDELTQVRISASRMWEAVQAGEKATAHLTAQAVQANTLPNPDKVSREFRQPHHQLVRLI